MKILVEKIFVFYIGLCVVICNLLPIPELIKGFLAMFSFLIIPYLVGNAFFQAKFFREIFVKIDAISYSFLAWSFGFSGIVLSLISLYPLHLLNAKLYSFTLSLLLIIYYFLYFFYSFVNKSFKTNKQKDESEVCENIIKYENKRRSHKINKCYINKKIGVILFGVCIIYSLFLIFFTPFPLWFAPDVFGLNAPKAWLLIDYGEFTIDGFYINSIAIIAGIASVLFNIDPYTFQWMCAHLLFPAILVFGLYFFLTNFVDKKLAVIGAFVGLWSIHQLYIALPLLTMYTPLVVSFLSISFAFFFVERNIVPYLNENKLSINSIFFLFVFGIISTGALWIIIKSGHEIGPFIYLYILVYFILIMLMLFKLLSNKLSNKNLRFCCFSLFVILSVFLFIHNYVGLSIAVAIVGYMFFACIYLKYTKKAKLIMLFVIVLFILFVVMQNYKMIDIQKAYFVPTLAFYTTLNFDDKLNLLMKQYPIVIIGLLFLGITNIILNSTKRLYASVTLFVIYLGIILFFFDFEIYRLIHIIHIFVGLFLSYGIIGILKYFKYDTIDEKILKNFIVFFIFIVLCFSMFQSKILTIKNYSDWLGGNYSSISLEEYSAGKWVKEHISKDTLIISDWDTGNAVSTISHIKVLPFHEIVSRMVANAILSPTPEEVYYKIKNITKNKWFIKSYAIDSKDPSKPYGLQLYHKDWIDMQKNTSSAIVVISARTIAWAESERPEHVYRTWLKMNERYKKYLTTRFFNETYFTLLYNNKEIYIFGVNPEPEVLFKIQNNTK